jgi:DNA invertase Pin-like site-specific DNA recombinase
MANGKFISYLRVSTARQSHSGLGLEAQRASVADYLNGGRWKLVAEVVEVESGKKSDRPKLAEALRLCRPHGATLVVTVYSTPYQRPSDGRWDAGNAIRPPPRKGVE